jgi:hypothetical protein
LKIFWNVVHPNGRTGFLNCGQGGAGGFEWYRTNHNTAPTKLMELDDQANLYGLNTVTCNNVKLGSSTLTSILLGYLTSVTSNVQTQINAINTSISNITTNTISSTLLDYLSTITSNVQTQIDNLQYMYFFNGVAHFANQNLPTTKPDIGGMKLLWNTDSKGMSTFLNCAQTGSGGFYWYYTNLNYLPIELMVLDNNANLSNMKNISCTSLTASTDGIANNGTLTNNADINVKQGNSVYVTTSDGTKFVRMHHNVLDAYFDYTGYLNFRSSNVSKANPTTTFRIDTNNDAIFVGKVTADTFTIWSNTLTVTVLGYLTSITANVQTQINTIASAVTALQATTLTPILREYLTVSSNVEARLNSYYTSITNQA